MNRFPHIGRAVTFSTMIFVLLLLALSSTFSAFAAPGDPVNVTFQLTVPAFTQVDTAVQIIGNRGATGEPIDPLTEWTTGVNMTQVSSTLWEVTLNFNPGDILEFKFRRDGDWDKEETQADGYTSSGNRAYTVPDTNGEPILLPLSVANWKDVLLVSVTPADGAASAAVSSNIVATFNKTISGASTFTVEDSANVAVAGAFSLSGDSLSLTFDPSADLAHDETYDVSIGAGIAAAGAGTREFVDDTSFTTAPLLVPVTFNVTVPWYELSIPNVYITGNSPYLGSNDPDFLAVTDGTVTTNLPDGATITYFYSRGSEATRETGADNATFASHTITVSNGLVTNDTVVFWEDPLVTNTDPLAGSQLFAIDAPISVSFSKNLNFGQNLVVVDPSNNSVAGVSSYNPATFTYSFTPNADLAYDTVYTITASGLVATDGAVQQYPLTFSFKTTPAPIDVTWTLTVPSFTPAGSTIFISYDYIIYDVAGAIALAGVSPMTPTLVPHQYTFTMSVLATVDVNYSFNRGSSNNEETEIDGETGVSHSFTVLDQGGMAQAVNDTVANWRDPIVVSVSPAVNSVNQSITSDIAITFNKPVSGVFSVVDSDSASVPGGFSLVGGSPVLTFTPSAPGFRYADTITVTVSGVVGQGTGTQEGTYSYSFETEAQELLTNGSFEDDPVTFNPAPWVIAKGTNEKVKCNDPAPRFAIAHQGQCAFMFRSSVDEKSRLTQNITDFSDVTLAVGDQLILSGWFSTPKNGDMRIQLRVFYADNSFTSVNAVVSGVSEYRKITVPTVTLTRTDIAKIRVQIRNFTKGSYKRAWVDSVSLKLRQGDVVIRGETPATAPLALPDTFRGGN